MCLRVNLFEDLVLPLETVTNCRILNLHDVDLYEYTNIIMSANSK